MVREWLDNPILVKHARSRLRPQAFATSAAITIMIGLCILYGAFQVRGFASGDGFTALMVLQFIILALMGSTQVGASVGNARASGILDFHRVSPQSPLELTLGFLFGAPIREYALTALTLPFMLFSVSMGFPDFRGLVQAEVLLLFAAWTLHAASLLGGLSLRGGGISGQNALGFTIVIGMFVIGPLFGAFGILKSLIDGDLRMDFLGLSLPWLAFALLHLAAVLFFFLLASTRKMGSERAHGLSKPQALAAAGTFGLLAVGGVSNWNGDGMASLILLYLLTAAGVILVGLVTPSLAEYDKGLRRARKVGLDRPPAWSDLAPNRPAVAAICGTILAAGSVLGAWIVDVGRPNVPAPGGFPLAVAVGVLVVAYFGLAYQYFLLRFGRRATNFFGLFLFTAWALPLVLGIIALAASSGPRAGEAQAMLFFSATPIVGVAAATGVLAGEVGVGPATIAVTLSLLFTFVFNALYTKAVRQVRMAVERSDDPDRGRPDLDLSELEAKPAAAAG